MTSDGGPAPKGWYPDHHDPSRYRYWDGAAWTDDYHDRDASLPRIGAWLRYSFQAIAAWPVAVIVLGLLVAVFGGLVFMWMIWWISGDLAVVDNELVGADAAAAVRLVVGLVALAIVGLVTTLAQPAFFLQAHLQQAPTVLGALRRAMVRVPRVFALLVGLALVLSAAIVVVALAISAAPALSVVVVLVAIPAAVWAVVKLAFLYISVVAVPTGTSAIRASALVSKGQFWPVFGRLVLLAIMVSAVSNIAAAALGWVASPFDLEQFERIFTVVGDEIHVSDFELRDLFVTGPKLILVGMVSGLINAAAGIVSMSALARLYVDSGAPTESWK